MQLRPSRQSLEECECKGSNQADLPIRLLDIALSNNESTGLYSSEINRHGTHEDRQLKERI